MRISIDNHIKDNIKHRYYVDANFDYDKRGKSIVDKYFPSFFVYGHDISKNAAFISKFLSVYSQSKHIPFHELLTCFIDDAQLHELLVKVKAKKHHISLIGYGGMGINLIHFISLLCEQADIKHIFRSLKIYEADNLSFSNTFRIYKDITHYPSSIRANNKLELFDEYNLSKDIKLIKKRFSSSELASNELYIGAPDFATRDILCDYNFIFIGHQNDNVMLISKPIVNDALTIESYGSINLATFFLNLIAVTLELLKQIVELDNSATLPSNRILYNYSILEDSKRLEHLNKHFKIYY